MRDGWRPVHLGEVAHLDVEKVPVVPGTTYQIAGVLNAGQGMLRRDPIDGSDTNYPALHRLRAGQLVMRKLTAWEGPITIVPEEYDGYLVSTEFPTFSLDQHAVLPAFMRLVCQQPRFWEQMRSASTGTVQRRKRVNPSQLLAIQILLPPIDEQSRIADLFGAIDELRTTTASAELAAGDSLAALARHCLVDGRGTEATLDEIAIIVMGQSPPGDACNTEGKGEPLLNGPTEFTSHVVGQPRQWTKTGSKRCEAGDILFCVRGATAGRINLASYPAVIGRGLAAIRAGNEPDTALLRFALWIGKDRLLPAAGGTIFPNISGSALRDLRIHWPPDMAERSSISDDLLALESYLESIRTSGRQLDGLRGALLEELLTGRHEIPDSYDDLLERAS